MVRRVICSCPQCGHPVEGFFDHIDIDCSHDMSQREIDDLLAARRTEMYSHLITLSWLSAE